METRRHGVYCGIRVAFSVDSFPPWGFPMTHGDFRRIGIAFPPPLEMYGEISLFGNSEDPNAGFRLAK